MDDLAAGVLAGDRTAMGRAITLVESTRPDDRRLAQELLAQLLPHAGGAHRVGISGVPGSGKSTLIDAIGTRLTSAGHRVGVLAVDPSSMVTGGSILGDKTRMATLAADENAFIRPSPSAGTLGGVTSTTPNAIAVLEAAGYDVVLVETMGVGQSEAAVHAAVDCLCGAGPWPAPATSFRQSRGACWSWPTSLRSTRPTATMSRRPGWPRPSSGGPCRCWPRRARRDRRR